MLLLDRFLPSGQRALDLATGLSVRIRLLAAPAPTPIFTRRGAWYLIDAGPRSARSFVQAWGAWDSRVPAEGATIDSVCAALADARDGCPRAVDVAARDADAWQRTVHDIARAARAAGFVPVAAEVLGEVLRTARWRWPRWLADRSLVVITCDGRVSAPASLALLRLASRDARPHLVVRGATHALATSRRLVELPGLVHDAAESSGWTAPNPPSAAALADRAWARTLNGLSDADTAATARWAVLLAPSIEVEASARAALAATLGAQGRVLEARAALAPSLEALSVIAPTVAGRVRDADARLAEVEAPVRPHRALVGECLAILEACQTPDDEQVVLRRVVSVLRERVSATTLACVAVEYGHTRVLAHVGPAHDTCPVAQQVIETGVAAPPPRSPAASGAGAWPVRYSGTVVGALWASWPCGLAVGFEDVEALMGVAAAAVAPVVYAATERGRLTSDASVIPDLVGESTAMRAVRVAVSRAARSPFPVLIEGESGSGKELVARAIHQASPRRDRRFVALNCAALAEDVAEAELFGHARGAFTGAVAERAGLFEDANGGTLFLDEVSELSARIQAKLLRVLQEHEVRRLGETAVRRIDTRIVAATNRPLEQEVEAGRFRRDLRYRLDVVRLSIPPLRERIEDVPLLVRHCWSKLSGSTGSRAVLTPGAIAALGRYDWPGNVRELQNVLASIMVSAPPRGVVSATDLPAHVGRTASLVGQSSLADARREFERRYVSAALARASGRPGLAARDLGISRQGLVKLLTRLGLATPPAGAEAG